MPCAATTCLPTLLEPNPSFSRLRLCVLPTCPHLLYPFHAAAFHTSWFGFFASFYSTFAPASLAPYIIPDLNLTDFEWGISGTMAVMGTIFFRLAMGLICDKFGARKGLGYLLLGTTPAIIIIMFAQNAWQFILMRCIIGFSLATFVATQFW